MNELIVNYLNALLRDNSVEMSGWDNKSIWFQLESGNQKWLRVEPLDTSVLYKVENIEAFNNSTILSIDVNYSVEDVLPNGENTIATKIKFFTSKGKASIFMFNKSNSSTAPSLVECEPPQRPD